MAEPVVDCVIPTHGRPQYLREALRSVLDQTVAPRRVVVVSDDGGTGVRQVVAEVSGHRPATELVLLDRGAEAPGPSASRNLGARVGDAPLLAFLDDDDVWDATYLERAVDRLQREHVDAVVTATQRFSGAGPTSVRVPLAGLDARGAFRRNPGMTGSNMVLTRTAFTATGGFDPAMPVQNDRDLFLRFLEAGHTYAVETAALVGVREHASGRLTDASVRRADGILLFDAKHGPRFGWWDRRIMRYSSHYTRMSAASSRTVFVRSALGAVVNWSPTVGRDLPLDLMRPHRVRKALRELISGAW